MIESVALVCFGLLWSEPKPLNTMDAKSRDDFRAKIAKELEVVNMNFCARMFQNVACKHTRLFSQKSGLESCLFLM